MKIINRLISNAYSKRTWNDLNVFEQKIWRNTYSEKLKELKRMHGHKQEMYVLAKQYANQKVGMKIKR